MARPTVLHKGFLIPNAGDVASPQMAEPDRIDFNTLGNARFGVIEGCEVTVSGTTAMNTPGTAIVDGKLVTMAGSQSADLGAAGTQDRYDLLTVTSGGLLKVTPGTPGADPVFPDPPTTATVLAAVFCPAGAGSLVDNVIDKRKMLSNSLLTKIPEADSLVVNRNGSGDLFKIDGGGTTSWSGDTSIWRSAPGTLQIADNLGLAGDLAVGDAITATSLTTTGRVQSSNLRRGSGPPTGTAAAGDLYQSDTGKLYIYQGSSWMEMASVQSAIPIGTIITSLVAPGAIGAGWVPLDGKTVVNESVNASLFGIPAMTQFITGGAAGNRQMTMPDATQRVLMGDFLTAGTRGGQSTFTINLANMPPHLHDVTLDAGGGVAAYSTTTSSSGRHGHNTLANSGKHGHPVNDPGHAHNGMANPVNGMRGAVVALMWGGQNKIDAYFNDRSHTYSVEAMDWTMPAFSNVSIGDTGSEHVHVTDTHEGHEHVAYHSSIPAHPHTLHETSKGSGTPISYTPLYLSVYVYIRQ